MKPSIAINILKKELKNAQECLDSLIEKNASTARKNRMKRIVSELNNALAVLALNSSKDTNES